MTRVALPVSDTRVSPLFDVARTLLVANVTEGKVAERARSDMGGESALGRVRLVSSLGATVLMCGGISRPVAAMVEAQGIQLIPWVAGEVEEVLAAYLEGRLPAPQFMMPGCCGRRRRRGRGHGTGRGRAGFGFGSPWNTF